MIWRLWSLHGAWSPSPSNPQMQINGRHLDRKGKYESMNASISRKEAQCMDYGWCGVGVVLWRNLPCPPAILWGRVRRHLTRVSIKQGKVGCNNRWCHYQMQKSFCVRSQILLRGHGAIMQNQTCKRCLMMF